MSGETVSWTEKYRPKTLDQVEGNPTPVSQLRSWAQSWTEGRPDKPGAILVGEAGIGKTSAALALANEMGWSVIELNASDARNKDAIERVVTRGAVSRGFSPTGEYEADETKGRKLIILDEADNVFGRQDRGGMQQIVETLKQTQQPIILTANDAYALRRKASALKRLCVEITFKRVKESTVAKILGRICKAEGLQADLQALEALAGHSGGDVRAAITDLEAIVRGTGAERITTEMVDALGYRDTRSSVFDALETILGGMDLKAATEITRELDEDPESLLLWIEENAPREYTDPEDRARAMGIIARADEFLGATRRTQYYRFWAVASDLMTGGVAVAKRQAYRGWTRYQFPSWLRKMSRSKQARGLRDGLGAKVGGEYHTGIRTAQEHLIPTLSFVAQRSEPFAVHLAAVLDLEADELALLLDMGKGTKTVARILEAAEEAQEAMAQAHDAPGLSFAVPHGTGETAASAKPRPEARLDQPGTDEDPQGAADEDEAGQASEPDEADGADEDEEDEEEAESQRSLFEF